MDWPQFRDETRRTRGGRENLVVLERCGSTNERAQRYAASLEEDEIPPETLFLAWQQTAGRGRQGRSWSSPAGLGVYATLVHLLRSEPPTRSERLAAVPMLVGVALAEGLEAAGATGLRLKWPNDLVVGGRKIGGVLIESRAAAAGALLLIGFGINVAQAEGDLPSHATSLRLLAGAGYPSPARLGPELAARVERRLRAGWPLARAVAEYRAWSAHRRGDHITFRVAGELLEGELLALDERGCLRLLTAHGERTLAAGEVIEATAVAEPGGAQRANH